MCGRATLISPVEAIVEAFGVAPIAIGPPRFNVAPSQQIPVVRTRSTGRELAMVRWGLVPWWSKDAAVGNKFIQARAETVATAPAFRDAFKTKRCLVVVDGFYEWSGKGASRRAHHVRLPSGTPFALAGVWSSWKSPEGVALETCAVVTTASDGALAHLHDRMPLVLDGEARELWLSASADDARAVIASAGESSAGGGAEASRLVVLPVSSWVNDVRHDDPRCLDPPGETAPLPQTTLRFE